MIDFRVSEGFLENNFSRNMSAFKKYLPDIFDLFLDYKEDRYFLVYDGDGNYNLYDSLKECNVYYDHPMKVCAKVLKDYKNSPILFSRLQGGAAEAAAKINPIHVSTTVSLAHISMGVQALSNHTLFPKRIKSMLFVGVGVGHDVQNIIDSKDIENLIIIEKDIDIFYASMYLIEWDSILEKFNNSGRNLSIILDKDPDFLSEQFFSKITSYGHFVANALFMYCPLNIDGYDELIDKLSNIVRGRLLAGFGFYEDARYSVAATYENVKRNIPLYIKNNKLFDLVEGVGYPVFVIGNGPSLDKDIEFIRSNINKAIIISCGSAIKTLERNNIQPDFHVECERTAWTKSWLDQVNPDFIKRINFIGLNVIYPDVYKMFNKVGMVAKTGETGSMMLASALERLKGEPYLPIHSHVNPTVAHMGVGLTPFFGMRKFYLFGIDMGYKNPSYHHSKYSSYSDLKDNYKEEYSPKGDKSFEIKANFASSNMLTNNDYVTFRVFLEGMIGMNHSFFGESYECFNCSDGAYIKFATPMEDRDFMLDLPDLDKNKIINRVMDDFFDPSICDEVVDHLDNILHEDINIVSEICQAMASHFSKPVSSVDEAVHKLDEVADRLFHSEEFLSDDKAYLLTLFSGSLLYFFSTITRILYFRVDDQKVVVDASNEAFSRVAEFFERVEEDYKINCLKNDSMEFHEGFFVDK